MEGKKKKKKKKKGKKGGGKRGGKGPIPLLASPITTCGRSLLYSPVLAYKNPEKEKKERKKRGEKKGLEADALPPVSQKKGKGKRGRGKEERRGEVEGAAWLDLRRLPDATPILCLPLAKGKKKEEKGERKKPTTCYFINLILQKRGEQTEMRPKRAFGTLDLCHLPTAKKRQKEICPAVHLRLLLIVHHLLLGKKKEREEKDKKEWTARRDGLSLAGASCFAAASFFFLLRKKKRKEMEAPGHPSPVRRCINLAALPLEKRGGKERGIRERMIFRGLRRLFRGVVPVKPPKRKKKKKRGKEGKEKNGEEASPCRQGPESTAGRSPGSGRGGKKKKKKKTRCFFLPSFPQISKSFPAGGKKGKRKEKKRGEEEKRRFTAAGRSPPLTSSEKGGEEKKRKKKGKRSRKPSYRIRCTQQITCPSRPPCSPIGLGEKVEGGEKTGKGNQPPPFPIRKRKKGRASFFPAYPFP